MAIKEKISSGEISLPLDDSILTKLKREPDGRITGHGSVNCRSLNTATCKEDAMSQCDSITIPLTRGYVATIDKQDFDLVSRYTWRAAPQPKQKTIYAVAVKWLKDEKRKTTIRMHRLILGVEDSAILVDHRDGDGLNNRRSNIRVATTHQNCCNQRKTRGVSRFKGVWFNKRGKRTKRWIASIKAEGKRLSLGAFLTEEEAALAYDRAALQYYGEFACLNFPACESGTAPADQGDLACTA